MKSGVVVISAILILSAFMIVTGPTGGTDPHLEGDKAISPGLIYSEGKGSPDKATVGITVFGAGDPFVKKLPQDVVFTIDSSGSMTFNDNDPDGPCNGPPTNVIPKRVEAAWNYVDNLTGPDRGSYVDFDVVAKLKVPLTTNYNYLKKDPSNGLWCSDQFGGTLFWPALTLANDELIFNGSSTHIKVIIFLTDGESNDWSQDWPNGTAQAARAAANEIIIFSIGLNIVDNPVPPSAYTFLNTIASMTGGQYFDAPNATALDAIFNAIMNKIINTAAKSIRVTEELSAEFEYILGSFSIAPTSLSGKVATWEIPSLSIGEYWNVTFDVSSDTCGYQMDVDEETIVTYISFDGSNQTMSLPSVKIDVVGCSSPPVADCGGPYSGNEGSPIQLDASGSYDPDNDPLSFRWDFGNDGVWDTDWMSDPTVERTWYDDYFGTVVLEVSDGNLTDADTSTVTVNNVVPVAYVSPEQAADEGDTVESSGTFSDPGLDDTFAYAWNFDDGTSISGSVAGTGNLLANGDFSNGLTGWSTSVEAATTILQVVPLEEGHDNVLEINNPVSDSDGDWDWAYQTLNLDVSGYSSLYFEADGKAIYQSLSDDGWVGGEYPVHFSIRFRDVNGVWHNGILTDNPWQQGFYYKGTGQYPYSNPVAQNAWFHYKSGNLMDLSPKPAVIGTVRVGSSGWAYQGMIDNVMLYGFPILTTSHTYGDNGIFSVTLTITDDDGGTATIGTNVTVLNLDPEITDVNATALKNAPRTQGYWNHQCTVTVPYGDHTGVLQEWIDDIGVHSKVFAGTSSKDEVCDILDPEDRSNMLLKAKQQLMAVWLNVASGKLHLLSPLDLPALTNSMTVGDAIDEIENIIQTVSDKDALERAKDIADKMNNFIGLPMGVAIITADAQDPGSDDLIFGWDWDDGNSEVHEHYNDGANPDPYPSPWGTYPFSASDGAIHAYYAAGVYAIELAVKDDDSGETTYSITIDLS